MAPFGRVIDLLLQPCPGKCGKLAHALLRKRMRPHKLYRANGAGIAVRERAAEIPARSPTGPHLGAW